MTTLALIGVGRWGTNFLTTVEGMKDCRIKYIAATSKDTLSKFPDKYIKTTNYKDLLRFDDIDGVIIATPSSTHYEIVKELMHKGFDIFVEKPFTTDIKSSLNIKKLFTNRSSNIMVGYIYLYNPAFATMKKLITNIGDIRYISFKLCNYGPFRNDSSVLWELGSHGVSVCLDILNDFPQSVSAWGIKSLKPQSSLVDNAFIKLKFNSQIECFIEVGWLFPTKRREIIIYGSRGTLLMDDLTKNKITIFEGLGPILTNGKVIEQIPNVSSPKFELTSPLEAELKDFLNLIKNGAAAKTDLDYAIKVEYIIDRAEKSLQEEGKSIELQLP